MPRNVMSSLNKNHALSSLLQGIDGDAGQSS